MTDIQKKFYSELPIGEWVKRDDYQYRNGNLRWNWQLSFTRWRKHNLVEIEFRDGEQYIRRKPTSEL
jgi:hypothetical protein